MSDDKPKRKRRSAAADDMVVTEERLTTAHGLEQPYLDDDMGPIRDEEIEAVGRKMVEAADHRQAWTDRLNGFKEAVIDLMVRRGLDEYSLDVDTRSFKLVLQNETKVKACKLKISPRDMESE